MRLDREKAKRNIKSILERMQSGSDISLLKEYHAIYKKEVSIFRRSWTAAWLFMNYDQKEMPFYGKISGVKNKPLQKSPNETGRKSAEKSFISPGAQAAFAEQSGAKETAGLDETSGSNMKDEETKRLFISIGKNRRLYPREIITLIMAKTETQREEIGAIKILDNYSFVQVKDIKAEDIISALNGLKFRGRTIAVNYAKPKVSDE